jgi:hypothetical protein
MRTLFLIASSFFAFVSLAQPGDAYSRSRMFVDFRDAKTKLHGFKNENGKIVIPAIYSMVHFDADNGTWDVQKDSLFGLYSREGKLILNPVYKFIELHKWNIYKKFIVVSEDNKNFGLRDLNGSKLLDLKYPKIKDFRKNLLLVYSTDSILNNLVIDTMLNVILDSKIIHANVYGFVDYSLDVNDTTLYIQAIKDGKIAVFACNGRQISDFVFNSLLSSRGNLIQGCLGSMGKQCGVIDQNNRIIIPFKYYFAGVFDNGTIRTDTGEGESFYFDSEGKLISENEFKMRNVNYPYWGKD